MEYNLSGYKDEAWATFLENLTEVDLMSSTIELFPDLFEGVFDEPQAKKTRVKTVDKR